MNPEKIGKEHLDNGFAEDLLRVFGKYRDDRKDHLEDECTCFADDFLEDVMADFTARRKPYPKGVLYRKKEIEATTAPWKLTDEERRNTGVPRSDAASCE